MACGDLYHYFIFHLSSKGCNKKIKPRGVKEARGGEEESRGDREGRGRVERGKRRGEIKDTFRNIQILQIANTAVTNKLASLLRDLAVFVFRKREGL